MYDLEAYKISLIMDLILKGKYTRLWGVILQSY